MSAATPKGPSAAAVRCDNVHLSFRLPEKKQRIKDVFMAPRSALRTRTFEALNGVSFSVGKGEILGVVGNNGAGKSTLLRVIGGVYHPDRGSVQVEGRIGMLMELGAGFHPDLTGRENIQLNASLLGVSNDTIADSFDDIVAWSGLEEFIDMEVRHYSSGMKARLGFAVAAELRPEVLLIDEVLSVGDAEFRRKCDRRFEEFVEAGTTILLVTHSLALVRERCTQALWLDHGLVRSMGPADEVLAAYQADLQEARQNSLAIENRERSEVPPVPGPSSEAEATAPAQETEAAETQEKEAVVPEPSIPLVHPSDANPPAMPALPREPRRWGVGGLSIDEVVLRARDGERRYVVGLFDYLRFDLRYRTADAPHALPLRDVHFGIQLATSEGMPVAGVNTLLQGEAVDEPAAEGLVAVEIPAVTLTNGLYLVSAFAFITRDGERMDLDYRQHCAVFEVTGGPHWKLGVYWLQNASLRHFAQPPSEADSPPGEGAAED